MGDIQRLCSYLLLFTRDLESLGEVTMGNNNSNSTRQLTEADKQITGSINHTINVSIEL